MGDGVSNSSFDPAGFQAWLASVSRRIEPISADINPALRYLRVQRAQEFTAVVGEWTSRRYLDEALSWHLSNVGSHRQMVSLVADRPLRELLTRDLAAMETALAAASGSSSWQTVAPVVNTAREIKLAATAALAAEGLSIEEQVVIHSDPLRRLLRYLQGPVEHQINPKLAYNRGFLERIHAEHHLALARYRALVAQVPDATVRTVFAADLSELSRRFAKPLSSEAIAHVVDGFRALHEAARYALAVVGATFEQQVAAYLRYPHRASRGLPVGMAVATLVVGGLSIESLSS